MKQALVVVSTTLTLAAGGAGTAAAEERVAADAPVVVSPAEGSVLDAPLTSVTVDFTGVEPGRWRISSIGGPTCGRFACPGDTVVEVGSGDTVREVTLDEPIAYDADYDLFVSDDLNAPGPDAARSTFGIDGAVAYDDVTQRNRVFSPLDRDGRRDTTTLSFTALGAAARPRVYVAGPGERVVRRGGLRGDRTEGFSVTWNGRDDDGDPVDPEPYDIVVDATDAAGVVTRLRRGVEVEDLTSGRSRVPGGEPASRSQEGRCRIRSGDDSGTARLTCRGDGTAGVTYRVPIPAGARVERFWVRGVTSQPADSDGRRTVRLRRVEARAAILAVRVTGEISAVVRDVNVRWTVAEG